MKELISELAGLCFEKGVHFQYNPEYKFLSVETWGEIFFHDDIYGEQAPQLLKNAIEKVKAL